MKIGTLMVKVAEEGHDQVVHELIRVGAEVDVQIILKHFSTFILIHDKFAEIHANR